MAKRFAAIAATATAGLLLHGCGGETTAAPGTSPTPAPNAAPGYAAPAGAAIQYFRFTDHDYLPTECKFYTEEHLARKVPDSCCDESNSGNWSSTPADTRADPFNSSDSTKYTCYVRERAPPNNGSYIRNSLACYEGKLQGAEGCTPDGLSMGPGGYPMNSSEAAKHSLVSGDPSSCNCESGARYKGDGCFVALSGFMKGLAGAGKEATFLKISGDTCGQQMSEFV